MRLWALAMMMANGAPGCYPVLPAAPHILTFPPACHSAISREEHSQSIIGMTHVADEPDFNAVALVPANELRVLSRRPGPWPPRPSPSAAGFAIAAQVTNG
jgi:hypothetical protein